MNIAQLTPGTGIFFCENCLHDSALVSALNKIGADATMVPMYLPVVEESESAPLTNIPIQFGGVNTYLQQKSALFRHTPAWLDSLMNGPALLKYAASRPSTTKASLVGEILISMLKGPDGHQAKEVDKLTTFLKDEIKPDVVILSNIMLLGLAEPISNTLKIPVVCSMQGEDVYLDEVPAPYSHLAWELISQKASHAKHFIAVSRYYADQMKRRLKLPDHRVSVVHSGIDVSGYRENIKSDSRRTITFMSRIIPDKGVEELIRSTAKLKKTPELADTRLVIAGSTTSSEEKFLKDMVDLTKKLKIDDDCEFRTNISRDDKIQLLSESDIVSVPCRYADAFGLFILEALAAGAAVVQPDHGGFSEVINDTGGGLCYDLTNTNALTECLVRLLTNHDERKSMAKKGRTEVMENFSDISMAEKTLSILNSL